MFKKLDGGSASQQSSGIATAIPSRPPPPPPVPPGMVSSSSASFTSDEDSNHKGVVVPPNLMYSSSASNRHAEKVRIGGPGTILPFWLESLLSWIFAISCLGVAMYHWLQQVFGLFNVAGHGKPVPPLMTHSRYEITNASGVERYQQLMQYLELRKKEEKTITTENNHSIETWTDDDWIETIRNDHVVRRLVSLIRLKQDEIPSFLSFILERFNRIWPELFRLPPLPPPSLTSTNHPPRIEISIVTSAYKEVGRDLVERYQKALEMATHPEAIELILVNAGHCQQLHLVAASTILNSQFVKVTILDGVGGGRGPSLNQGAARAQGRILTFLHADTRLSFGWDMAIRNAFHVDINSSSSSPSNSSSSSSSSSNKSRSTTATTTTTTTACAFSFAIDTTPEGLHGGPFPPGIQAIEATANWRTHLFHLPYGDQCLSIPRVYFNYLGGYPHQCLMEDYELVRLLRHRVACHQRERNQERLAILPQMAYCGPRRWQTFGVLYVTYTNSRCVNLYASGTLTPDELFQLYYGVPANNPSSGGEEERKNQSPWEVELHEQLSKYKTNGRQ